MKNLKAFLFTNREIIRRKVVVTAGATAGLILTAVMVDRLGDRRAKPSREMKVTGFTDDGVEIYNPVTNSYDHYIPTTYLGE